MQNKIFTTKNITVTAVLSAMAYVLYLFVKFPLPFFPPFLDIQISDAPALIGGFMMGPISGCVIILVKCLLKLPFSSTAGVGELADLCIGCVFVIISSLVYQRKHTKKGALLGLIFGSIGAVIVSVIANAFVLVPFYFNLYGINTVIGMMSNLFKNISEKNFYLYYLPLSILPFNILRCALCSAVTFLVYRQLHKLVQKMFPIKNNHLKKEHGQSAAQENIE